MIEQVVIVSDSVAINGGGAKVAIQTARVLADHGIKVFFFGGNGSVDNLLIHENIEVINLEMGELVSGSKLKMFFQGMYNKKAKNEFKKLLKRIDLSKTIIHIHAWSKTLSPSIFVPLRKLKKDFYITAHDYFLTCPNGGYFIYPKNIICKNKKGIKCLCTNCDSRNYIFKIWRYIRQKIQNKCLSKCNYKIFIISKLMNDNLSSSKEKIYLKNPITMNGDKIEALTKKPKCFAYIGRLSKEKGIEYFCDALVKTNYNGLVFGDGVLTEELKRKYSIYPNIKFLGWKKFDEIKDYFDDISALIFPSIWYEGAPLTIPELQSYGIPCIVSDVCSGTDYIHNGENGYIFESKNINDLISKMNIINDMDLNTYNIIREKTNYYALNENHQIEEYYMDLISKYEL